MVQRINTDKATALATKPAGKKTELVVELLGGLQPNDFGLRWIEGSQKVTETSIREAHEFLTKECGITNKKIRTFVTLLAKPIEKLRYNYTFLRDEMHLSPEKIAANASLLGRNPDTVRKNGTFLRDEMHLSPEKIASRAELLGMNPDTVRKNGTFLRDEMHLSPEKIATNASLLGMNPDTVRKKLENMLRDGVERQKIDNNPVLLGLKRETAIRYVGTKSKTAAV